MTQVVQNKVRLKDEGLLANFELLFDEPNKRYSVTQSELINFTLAEQGNIEGYSILIELEADLTNPIYFDSKFIKLGGQFESNKINYLILYCTQPNVVLFTISQGESDEFDIIGLEGLIQYLQGNDPTKSIESTENTWEDSKLGDIWTTQGGVEKPVYSSANNSWVFTGAREVFYLSGGVPFDAGLNTLFLVINRSANVDSFVFGTGDGLGYHLFIRPTSLTLQRSGDSSFNFTIDGNDYSNQKVIIAFRPLNTGYVQLWRNNEVQAGDGGSSGVGYIDRIGIRDDAFVGKYLNGDFHNMTVFNRVVTDEEMSLIFGSLNSQYGVY